MTDQEQEALDELRAYTDRLRARLAKLSAPPPSPAGRVREWGGLRFVETWTPLVARPLTLEEARLHGDPAVIRQAEIDALRGR